MPPPQRSVLHGLYNARRASLFNNHVRIAKSIFFRPCSCTATLRDEAAAASSSKLKTVAHDPPKPPADHRKLATKQKLFITSPYSPGSPLLLPNGADMFIKLTNLLRSLYPKFGFREVITPTIYKKSLWEKSGHWENYAEDMFEVRGRGATGQKEHREAGEDEEFGLKPMNCPGHCLLFASEKRSYRDLPVRFADFSPLHRNEISGALSGLTRVRRFHQDDAHIFCRPSQIEEEIRKTMDFIELIYSNIFDFGPYRLVLSTRPESSYIGSLEEWNRAENQLKAALDQSGREWSLNEGDGAFYGPKIDIILKDSDGKEHQTATIQLDFQLPQRFGLEYDAPDVELELKGETSTNPSVQANPGQVTPIIIHRAILGSLERFLALLIEHYNGLYPLWISPHPVKILTAASDAAVLDYAQDLAQTFQHQLTDNPGISKAKEINLVQAREEIQLHPSLDLAERSLSKKIRVARSEGYNFIFIVGEKEARNGTVALQLWNQRQPHLAAKLLPPEAEQPQDSEQKGWQIQMKAGQAIGFLQTLAKYHL